MIIKTKKIYVPYLLMIGKGFFEFVLEISIISPLLKSKLEKNELNVESVIKERCSFDQNIQISETEWIIKQFKGIFKSIQIYLAGNLLPITTFKKVKVQMK